jgi:hypothetical protein
VRIQKKLTETESFLILSPCRKQLALNCNQHRGQLEVTEELAALGTCNQYLGHFPTFPAAVSIEMP